MMTVYLLVACLGYGLGAGDQDLVSSVKEGLSLRLLAGVLLLHVVVVYLIKSLVLARYFHQLCSPQDLEARTCVSYLKHGSWGVAMLAFGWTIANAIPFFSQLLGIIGGLFAGPINFLLPILLYLLALGHNLEAATNVKEKPREAQRTGDDLERTGDGDTIGSESTRDSSAMSSATSSGMTPASATKLVCNALCRAPTWEAVFMVSICLFVLLTMVIGVTQEVVEVIHMEGKFGNPFNCHALKTQPSAER
jgi:hypothetical protein